MGCAERVHVAVTHMTFKRIHLPLSADTTLRDVVLMAISAGLPSSIHPLKSLIQCLLPVDLFFIVTDMIM